MDRLPGLSNDRETAPLLRDPEHEEAENQGHHSSFADHVGAMAQEPLTPLTKALLVLALVLLLLSSIFIGLFAGAQHKLKLEQRRNRGGGDMPGGTVTVTSTMIPTASSTQVTTTTTTRIRTTTVLPGPSPTKIPDNELCFSPQCIILSASMLSSLDTSQDPCENFYDFSNGGWLRAHPLPVDKESFGKFEALSQQNKQVIQRILESNSSMPSSRLPQDAELLRKLRGFYSSCLNEHALEDRGAVPLLDFVQTIKTLYRGGELQISSATDLGKSTDLTAALAYLHSRGINAFFSLDIKGDDGVDPNHMVLWFSQSGLSLPSKEYYEDESVLDEFQTAVEKVIFALTESETSRHTSVPFVTNENANVWPPWPWPPWGDDDDTDKDKEPVDRRRRARKIAKQVVKLECRLAKASLDLDVLYQDPIRTYNPLPLSNFTDSLPQIHFPTYLAAFTPRTFPEKVIVTYPAYIASLSDILEDTAVDVIEAYLVTRAALTLSPYLGTNTEVWRAQRSLEELLTGIKKGVIGDRAEYCVGRIEEALGFAAGRYFVNETFSDESKERGTQVIRDIIKSFKASLPHIDWMDEKSANAAAEKADAIRVKVGFPLSPDTQDPGSILKYYSSIEVHQDDFFGNMISAAINEIYIKWSQLGRQRNRDSWDIYPSLVNAYFDPSANEIVFPAGILQPPFVGKGWPSYLSYGAFGHVASHELTHAFDSAGRLYNQAGKLEKWWTNSTSKGFEIKQDCIVKQFSAYTVDDGKGGKIHINGNLTSGENIADTGLIQAYRAWKAQFEESRKTGKEYLLPGLGYTREQLFFISFAQIWGNAMKATAAVQRVRSDPHSPTRYRVDGTVYNIPEFAEAFQCSSQAKLNPPHEKRCLFW